MYKKETPYEHKNDIKILLAALTLIVYYLVTINHINDVWTVNTMSHLLYRGDVVFG